MLPKTHFFLALLFSILLYALGLATPLQALTVLAAGVLIDVDHWLVYAIKKKDLSIKRAYRWFYQFYKKNVNKGFLCIFHTIEAFILVALLSIKFQFFLFVLIGMAFHNALDIAESIHRGFYGRPISLICFLWRGPASGRTVK